MPSAPDEATPGASLPLKELPSDQLPREKLRQQGRASLSDEELLALFLRTGLPGCNVLELAALLKRRAGSLAALGRLEAEEITELCKGIGPAKAATLAAVFELGRRAAREKQSTPCLRDAGSVYEYLVDEMRFLDQERLYVLLCNSRMELIRCIPIGMGTLTRLITHPRDIFRDAVRHNAATIIMAHNHPSGNPTPSQADTALTEQIVKAGDILHIPLRDHVIIGAPTSGNPLPYYSFRETGHMPLC